MTTERKAPRATASDDRGIDPVLAFITQANPFFAPFFAPKTSKSRYDAEADSEDLFDNMPV